MAQSKLELILEWKNKAQAGISKFKKRVRSDFNDMDRGIARFKGRMTGAFESIKNKNAELFGALADRLPFIRELGPLLSNPYTLALAAVIGLTAGINKLGAHMSQVTKDINANQRTIQATFGSAASDLDRTESRIHAVSKVLKVDFIELSNATNALQKQYDNLSIDGALDLIKQGLQGTNGQLDLDEIKEYSSQMRDAGLTAKEFTALSIQSRREGVFGDKGLDSVKEFNLRVREMVKSGADALKGLDINANTILKGLDDGSLRTMDVLRQVSRAMKGAKTQAQQATVADLFAGPGEDAGRRWLLKLADIDLNLETIMASMKATTVWQDKQIKLHERIRLQQSRYAKAIEPALQRWEVMKLRVTEVFETVLADAMTWLFQQWKKIEPIMINIWRVIKIGITPAIVTVVGVVKLLSKGFSLLISAIRGAYNLTLAFFKLLGTGIQWIYKSLGGNGNIWDRVFGKLDMWKFRIKTFFEDIADFGGRSFKLFEALLEFDPKKIKEAYKNVQGFAWRDSQALYQEAAANTEQIESDHSASSTPTPFTAGGATSLEGSSGPVRNLTVTIDSFIKGGVNVVHEGSPDSLTPEMLEQWFTDMMMRVVRNTETTAG